MEHEVLPVPAQRREIGIVIETGGTQHLGREGHGTGNVGHQQVEAEAPQRAAIVFGGYGWRLVGRSFLHEAM